MDMPTAAELEMFPYVDDSPLFLLEYAADVSDALPDEDTCYALGLDWHEIMGYLFAMCDAHQAMLMGNVLTPQHAAHVQRQLERMQYRPGAGFGGLESLKSFEDYEQALAIYNVLMGVEGGE